MAWDEKWNNGEGVPTGKVKGVNREGGGKGGTNNSRLFDTASRCH